MAAGILSGGRISRRQDVRADGIDEGADIRVVVVDALLQCVELLENLTILRAKPSRRNRKSVRL